MFIQCNKTASSKSTTAGLRKAQTAFPATTITSPADAAMTIIPKEKETYRQGKKANV